MKKYVKPSIRIAGSVASITRASSAGSHTDASFPTDTPFSDLTFS